MTNLENPASFYRACSDNLIGIFSLEHAFTDKRALGTGLHHEAKDVTIALLVVLWEVQDQGQERSRFIRNDILVDEYHIIWSKNHFSPNPKVK